MTAHQKQSDCQCHAKSHSAALRRLDGPDQHVAGAGTAGMVSHKQIERLILIRKLRATMIGRDLFADPAWDMLLALYAADLANKRLIAAEVCSTAEVPLSTANRWITVLEERHLVRTGPALQSKSVTLSSSGSSIMSRYFGAVSTALLPV